MKFINRQKFANWKEDQDGFLTVTAVILKEGVYPYYPEDFDEIPPELERLAVINEYIPASEFTPEALKTIEGKPITIATDESNTHEWRDSGNALRDGLTVGSTAGTPWVEDGKLFARFLIQDRPTIERIKSGELVEVSAAYTGDIDFENGSFDGKDYQAVQKGFHFNHVLLLPSGEGRLGKDARIINTKGKTSMGTHSVVVQFKNGRSRTYQFTNAEDKAEAEKMANETKEEISTYSSEEIGNAVKRCNELEEEIKVKNAELEENKKIITKYKEELDRLLDPEAQEEMARELLEQAEDEENITEVEIEETETDEVRNQLKNCKTRTERRRALVTHIMNRKGIQGIDQWSDDMITGSFASLAVSAKTRRQNTRKPVYSTSDKRTITNSSPDNLKRMLSFKNRKGDK